MKKIALLLIVTILFSSSYVFSQAGGNMLYMQNNRYIQNKQYRKGAKRASFNLHQNQNLSIGYQNKEMLFEVKALMNMKADSYIAIFNLVQVGKTAKYVDSLVNQRIKKFLSALKEQGLKDEDLFTDMISLVPVYEIEVTKKLFSKTYNEVPKGFELQKNIHIRYKKSEFLEKIVTAAAENEIYDLVKVEYSIENTEAVFNTLRKRSIEFFRKKINDFKLLNIDLDTIYHVFSENTSVAFPIDRYESYQALSGASMEANKSSKVVSVRKPKSMFYNKVPYHDYDIVINPEVLEPVIQYSYTLTIKYIVKEKMPKTKKEFILLTPEGVMKTLKVE